MTAHDTCDVGVIGAGLFGQIIATHLRSLGMSVRMFDAGRQGAGSKPAACLMKPSWFSSLGPEVYKPSLELLDQLYGVQDLDFHVGPATTKVHWCDPRAILKHQGEPVVVTRVEPRRIYGFIPHEREELHVQECRTVVVAAGIWSAELIDVPGLTGRAGCAFLFPDLYLRRQFIRPWAPYRQLVGFNRGDGAWVSDGSAIKPENWTDERQAQSLSRVLTALKEQGCKLRRMPLYGVRPYVPKVKPCYLHMEPGLIVATGGAKNGTLAAGWCAHEIGRALT